MDTPAPAAGPPAASARGALLIVGGSERLDRELRLLQAYSALADGVPGRRHLVIVTTATGHPEILGGEYLRLFRRMGWPDSELHQPPLATRTEAADPATAALIRTAAGIYLTGGDQVALVDILRDTPAAAALRAAYEDGAIIGGTSAGASALGDPMIARGGGTGELKRGLIALHPGLDLVGVSAIIDTHFGQRGRFPRLVAALAERPAALGVGIDENTAVLIGPGGGVADVLGSGVVYFLDSAGRPATVAPGGALGIAPLTLHILHEGQRYDLATRTLL